MKMHFCRICRTENNLKYTAKQLRQINKRQRFGNGTDDEGAQKLLRTTATLGNICTNCEEHLQIFNRLEDDDNEDSDVDVLDGVAGTRGSQAQCTNGLSKRQRADTPVIVDDDELLYNLFLQKVDQQRQAKRKCTEAVHQNMAQHSRGSGEDSTRVVEDLASQESTPDTQPQSSLTMNPLKIVAIIDLEEVDNLESQEQSDHSKGGDDENDNDDEKIIFRKVEPETANYRSPIRKQRKRYAENELRLVASLSLVSSESETEELKMQEEGKEITTATNSFKCKHCSLCLPDIESLSIHESVHIGVRCHVCQLGFPTSQRLVHHMRYKHRAYDGDVLTERPRCPQDSAMTIRLRYLQRYTYYECQLCGRIDAVFKEHKEHVIQQHAEESKSLRDPMMKELKCPLCKQKCGMQYLLLCRHLIANHTAEEYKAHLREVVHASKSGYNMSRQQEVARTARIYQFTKRKSFFFECKLCGKVVAGYLNHIQHMNAHKDDTLKSKGEKTEKKPKEKLSKTTISKTKPIMESQSSKRAKTHKRKERVCKKNSQSISSVTQVKRVKVKPPLRQVGLQTYNCKYCVLSFEGFRQLNLHLLKEHSQLEYQCCNVCSRAFGSAERFRNHLVSCSSNIKVRHKRKYNGGCDVVDENFNTGCKRGKPIALSQSQSQSQSQQTLQTLPVVDVVETSMTTKSCSTNSLTNKTNAIWLQDLLRLSAKQCTLSSLTPTDTAEINSKQLTSHPRTAMSLQCLHCTHLFANSYALLTHTKIHKQRQEMTPLLRYQPLTQAR